MNQKEFAGRRVRAKRLFRQACQKPDFRQWVLPIFNILVLNDCSPVEANNFIGTLVAAKWTGQKVQL